MLPIYTLTLDGWVRMMMTVRNLTASTLFQTRTVASTILRLHLHSSRSWHCTWSTIRIASGPWPPRCYLTIHHYKKKRLRANFHIQIFIWTSSFQLTIHSPLALHLWRKTLWKISRRDIFSKDDPITYVIHFFPDCVERMRDLVTKSTVAYSK